MKKHLISFALAGGLILLGAGCAPATPAPSAPANTAPEEDASAAAGGTALAEGEELAEAFTEPLKFSVFVESVGDILMGMDRGFVEYRFDNGQGTCIDQGLPNAISYLKDPELGYFIVESADKSYRNEWVSATASNSVMFDEVPLTGGSAWCLVKVPWGSDVADGRCEINDVEVCTMTYDALAIPE